jgi:hypothetical protein
MPDYHVIEELQDFLVAQGVAQLPSTAVSLTVPSVWTPPRDGAPLPRTGENVTITLVDTMLRSPSGLEPWLEETFVDVIVRARTAAPGKLVQRTIKNLIVPYDSSLGGRKQWTMGDLLVEYSTEWRGDQPLPMPQNVTSQDPHITYDRVQSFRFGVRRKRLAGLSIP